jgi:hypothetical protein
MGVDGSPEFVYGVLITPLTPLHLTLLYPQPVYNPVDKYPLMVF